MAKLLDGLLAEESESWGPWLEQDSEYSLGEYWCYVGTCPYYTAVKSKLLESRTLCHQALADGQVLRG